MSDDGLGADRATTARGGGKAPGSSLQASRIRSSILGLTYKVWLLASPRPAQRLGLILDAELYIEKMGAAALILDLQQRRRVAPATFLFVSHRNLVARHREYVCNPAYTRFLVEELLPWARKRTGVASRDDHLIGGLSLSGLAAAFAALQHPRLFSTALCQSPSAWWQDEQLAGLVSKAEPPFSRFWISVGDEERETDVRHPPLGLHQIASQLESCRRLATALGARGAETRLVEFAGGHDVECWKADLPDALRWLLPPAGEP